MQNSIYRLTCCSLLLGLSACNDNSNSNPNPPAIQKQLTSIETWIMDDMGNPLTQIEYITVKHANSRVTEFNIVEGSGPDKLWGTADDRPYSQISCQYAGKTATAIRDSSVQFAFPHPLLGGSISESVLLAALGIRQRDHSLCALDYQNDASIIEEEHLTKLGPNLTNTNVPFFRYSWKAVQQNNVLQGSNMTSTFIGTLRPNNTDCALASCAGNTSNTGPYQREFSYAGSPDLLIDSLIHVIHHYTWSKSQPVELKTYSYNGDVNAAIAQLNTLQLQSTTQYHYSNNQVKICTQYKSAIGGEQVLETYADKQLIQHDHFNAGEDSIACTSDDALIQRIKYNYQ